MKTGQTSGTIEHHWLVMASMMIGAFVGMLSETSLNIALPQLMQAFQIPAASVQWLVTGYMLVIGIILPFSSLLTKWFSTRQLVIFGLVDFIVGAVIAALAPNFVILLLGRMIQGLGTGIVLPLMFTVAMLIFPPQKLGTAMGVCALVIMLAPAIGPTLTGIILGKLSWNWVFWLFVPFLVLALILALLYLPNVGQITKPHVDVISLLESILGFGCLVMGVSFAAEWGWSSPLVLALILGGVIILGFYGYRQIHLENPIINLRLFSKRDFTVGALCVMLDFAIILSAMYLLPQYLQRGLLLPVAFTGMIMLPGGIVNALVSALSGRLFDELGARKPVIAGFLIAIGGIVLLLLSQSHSTVGYIITAHVVLMIGCPLAMSPAQTHALNSLKGLESADGSTILNTLQQIIGAVATALATSFLSWGQAAYQGTNHAARFVNGVHFGLYFTLALAVLGLVLGWLIKPQRR
ncbi:Permease of the major facilitator superfamily [Bombilactobacillus mellifer]|uniref:Permease of the major facilitator superfamily n=1 Tax=Bombilactobacillus mellifer TaxID=1218492 RepID=A0A0F4LPA2_9LACO|nr:DHA2 family efflux MFS transporter permease subunit [Bombilactobacillus mellifer]KJY60420.1 Permease of the major facilitator superfamily [Bombilactobacillus mellifer]MCT6826256.1 DHA2 family efflux MFS transporter permease subunit [Bombilactobacillus mellifer]MCT6894903.1 DHA2 family efflux MFS transporter permease subunit [Bombilactobacillus mellifer]